MKIIERLGLYISTQIKNGSDVKKFLMQEKLVKAEVPELGENHTARAKSVCEYCMGELMKTMSVLEGNLFNLFSVLMSQCHSDSNRTK